MNPDDLSTQLSALNSQLASLHREIVAPTVTDRILTLAEAIAYTKHESDSAFYRWCSRWHCTSVTYGRFARGQLDGALAREAAKKRLAKSAPRRSRATPQPVAA
jgi:hypothetical protein